jgi:hypothetical protein
MQLLLKELNETRTMYEASIRRVGEGQARVAFARGLNREGRKTYTQVKRALRAQTSIRIGIISAGTRFRPAFSQTLTTVIEGSGRELSLKLFGPKQNAAGTTALVWGARKMHKSAFMGPRPGAIARSLGGHVWHRTGSSRMPIEMLYGPSIPKEMVKDETAETFLSSGQDVIREAMRQLALLLPGARL